MERRPATFWQKKKIKTFFLPQHQWQNHNHASAVRPQLTLPLLHICRRKINVMKLLKQGVSLTPRRGH